MLGNRCWCAAGGSHHVIRKREWGEYRHLVVFVMPKPGLPMHLQTCGFQCRTPTRADQVAVAMQDVVLQNNVAPEAARLTSREPVYEQAAAADLASATAHAAVAAASKPATPDSELQDEIKECDCWEDVLDIVADEALQMSSSSIYIALRRLTLVTKGLPQSSTKQLVNKPSFQLLLQQMQRHLPAFDAVMLTNSLYSLSILRVPASKELLAAYDAQVETHLESFNMKDVVCCFYAYACLKHSPKKTLLDSMGLQAEHFLSSGAFNAQDISMLLWSCGTLHHKQADLINPLIIAALAKFDSFTTQGVANTTWALAKLESYSEPLMNKVADYISNSSNLRSARPQEVFNTLWGLAHLRHHPQQALPIVVDYTVRNMHRLRPVDLANLVYSLGMLSHHPGAAAMGKLLPKLEADLEQFSVVELCNVYWGLALIEEVQAPLYVTMTDKLQALQQQGKLADSLQRMFFTGFLSAKLSGAAVALDPPVLEALKSAWISAMHASEPSRHLELVAKQLRWALSRSAACAACSSCCGVGLGVGTSHAFCNGMRAHSWCMAVLSTARSWPCAGKQCDELACDWWLCRAPGDAAAHVHLCTVPPCTCWLLQPLLTSCPSAPPLQGSEGAARHEEGHQGRAVVHPHRPQPHA